MTIALLAIVLLGIFVYFEFYQRKNFSVSPKNYSELWSLSNRITSSDIRFPPIAFLTLTTLFFSFWECVIRSMVQAELNFYLNLLGIFCLLGLILSRYLKTKLSWSAFRAIDYALLWAGVALSWGPIIVLIASPFLIYRIRPFLNSKSLR